MQAIGTIDAPYGVGYVKITALDSQLCFNKPFDKIGEIAIDEETFQVDPKLHEALRKFFRKVAEAESDCLIKEGNRQYERGWSIGRRDGVIMCQEQLSLFQQSLPRH